VLVVVVFAGGVAVTITPTQRQTLTALASSISKFGTAVDVAAKYAAGIEQKRLALVIFMLHEQLNDCRREFLKVLVEEEVEADE
jgi:hypothetical protein